MKPETGSIPEVPTVSKCTIEVDCVRGMVPKQLLLVHSVFDYVLWQLGDIV